MQEIKCPKCGEIFQVDESGYAAIVKQVRDKEFEKEISSRETQFQNEKEAAIKLAQSETERKYQDMLINKENSYEKDKTLELNNFEINKEKALAEKDKLITELTNKIESNEKENLLKELSLKEQYKIQLQFKDEEIARY